MTNRAPFPLGPIRGAYAWSLIAISILLAFACARARAEPETDEKPQFAALSVVTPTIPPNLPPSLALAVEHGDSDSPGERQAGLMVYYNDHWTGVTDSFLMPLPLPFPTRCP